MARIPIVVLAALVLWVALTVYREGPERAFGGLFNLLGSPEYGEEARPTRSGALADHAEEEPEPPADSDTAWWSKP